MSSVPAWQELVGWLRDYAGERINSRLIDERRCIPPYIVLDFGRQGLLGMEVPKRYGGRGFSTSESLRVFEQLAAIDLTLASFVAVHHALGTRPILHFGTEGAKSELLPSLAAGRELGAFAITEPGAGSDPRALATTARPDGRGGFLLRGEKSWIGNGSWAGVTNVFAKEVTADGTLVGIAGFCVRQSTRGLRQGPEALTLGVRGMVQNTVYLEDANVGADDRLGAPGDGFRVAEDAMFYGRLGLGIMSVGGMKRCAQLMARYAARRTISGRALFDNPVTLARLGEITALITALEVFVYRIAEVRDAGGSVAPELYMVSKATGPESLYRAADWLLQLLGGRGYIETNLAPQILRDARLFRVFEGPTETLLSAIGSRVLRELATGLDALFAPFEAPGAAQDLATALEAVEHAQSKAASSVPRGGAQRWLLLYAGELTAMALLRAAVMHAARARATPELERAREWLERKSEELQASIERRAGWEARLSERSGLSELITGYAEAIGEVEQSLPGEASALAPELARQLSAPESSPSRELVQGRATGASANRPVELVEPPAATLDAPAREDVERWLVAEVAETVGLDAEEVDPTTPFFDFGFDSNAAVELAAKLSSWLKRKVDPTVAWDFPTIEALAAHLSRGAHAEARGTSDAAALPGAVVEDIAVLLARELESAARSKPP